MAFLQILEIKRLLDEVLRLYQNIVRKFLIKEAVTMIRLLR